LNGVKLALLLCDARFGGLCLRIGGHASCFSAGHCDSPFQPLSAPLLRYHRQLKAQLDPQGIFNPGRMYAEV